MGIVCVSSCRCCVFVSVVYPVAILSAVFCVICSLLMFVSDDSGDHMVETYSSMGLVIALYVAMMFPFLQRNPAPIDGGPIPLYVSHHHHRVIKLSASIVLYIFILYH